MVLLCASLDLDTPLHSVECAAAQQQPHDQRVHRAGEGELDAAGHQLCQKKCLLGIAAVHQRQRHALPQDGAHDGRGEEGQRRAEQGWPVRHIPPYRTGQQAVQDGGHAENGIVAEGGEQAADEIGGEAHHRPGNGAEQQARQHDRHGLQRDTGGLGGDEGQHPCQHHAQRGQQGADGESVGVEHGTGYGARQFFFGHKKTSLSLGWEGSHRQNSRICTVWKLEWNRGASSFVRRQPPIRPALNAPFLHTG